MWKHFDNFIIVDVKFIVTYFRVLMCISIPLTSIDVRRNELEFVAICLERKKCLLFVCELVMF